MRISAVAAAIVASVLLAPLGEAQTDSAALRASLQRAQARFERVRRQYLPLAAGLGRTTCQNPIGRICYWHDDDQRAWVPDPEHERVTQEREDLLQALDAAARRLPGDPWIAGQRVRYHLEHGGAGAAGRAARECRAEPWWCAALSGFALHVHGDYAAADSAFSASFAAMEPTERCRWTDLRDLLEHALHGAYTRAGCEHRDSLNRLVWWLADPLYLTAGNERRTAHYARHVIDRISHGAANPYGMVWRGDNREVLLRYGWAIGWDKRMGRGSAGASIIGHFRRGARSFVPPASLVRDPARTAPSAWELDASDPREAYAPEYATRFVHLEHQLAVLRRGDSAVIVAAFDLEQLRGASAENASQAGGAGAGRDRSPVEVGLTLTTRDDRAPRSVRRRAVGEVARLALPTTGDPGLVSLEGLNRHDSIAGRARYWLKQTAADGTPISHLLLLTSDSVRPRSLEEAIERARGSTTYEPGEPILVYWQRADVSEAVVLTVTRHGKSFLRRVVEFVGLASSEREPVTLQWPEAPSGPSRSVTLQLPDEREGRYTLRLRALSGEARGFHAERDILVRRR